MEKRTCLKCENEIKDGEWAWIHHNPDGYVCDNCRNEQTSAFRFTGYTPTIDQVQKDSPTIEGVGKDSPIVENEQGGKQSAVSYRFDLCDPKAMFAMTKVLYEGALKYGENENWRRISVKEHLNHLLIHTYAYLAGDTSDEHLSHIMCRALFAQAVELGE